MEWQRKVEIPLHSITFLPKQPVKAPRSSLILGFSVSLCQYRDVLMKFLQTIQLSSCEKLNLLSCKNSDVVMPAASRTESVATRRWGRGRQQHSKGDGVVSRYSTSTFQMGSLLSLP